MARHRVVGPLFTPTEQVELPDSHRGHTYMYTTVNPHSMETLPLFLGPTHYDLQPP